MVCNKWYVHTKIHNEIWYVFSMLHTNTETQDCFSSLISHNFRISRWIHLTHTHSTIIWHPSAQTQLPCFQFRETAARMLNVVSPLHKIQEWTAVGEQILHNWTILQRKLTERPFGTVPLFSYILLFRIDDGILSYQCTLQLTDQLSYVKYIHMLHALHWMDKNIGPLTIHIIVSFQIYYSKARRRMLFNLHIYSICCESVKLRENMG